MPVKVKLRCSECETILEKRLNAGETEIVCVVCGRRMANMPAEDYSDMERAQKSQCVLGIVSVVLFVAALGCVCWWLGDSGKWVTDAAAELREDNMPAMAGAAVCGLASMVCGIMASMKRFVVEF